MSEGDGISNFRVAVKKGCLTKFRNFLQCFSEQQFNQALLEKNDNLLTLAAAQRVMTLVASKTNVRALVNKNSGHFSFYRVPSDAFNFLNLSKLERLFAQASFISLVLKISFARFLRAIICLLKMSNEPHEKGGGERIFIFDISSDALNRQNTRTEEHTLENWIRAHFNSSNCTIYHSVKGVDDSKKPFRKYVSNFLPYLPLKLRVLTALKGCVYFIHGYLTLLTGNWRPLFMVDDWIYCQCFAYASSSEICDRYCFLFQGSQYRPAWTYIAERKGGKAVLINYSANFVPSLDKKLHDRDYLNTATWNEIVPFHKKFAAFMEEAIGKHIFQPKIIYSNPVYLNDDYSAKLPLFERPTIALFDVQPLDEKFHIGFMDQHDYMENNDFEPGYYNEMFIKNVVSAARQNDFHVALKPKRQDHRVLKNYQKLLLELEAQGVLTIVSPSIAPSRLLESTAGGVILPFSTVGYFDIPQETLCFYDVVGCFDGSHQAAFETKVISRFEDLMNWMSHLKTQC